MKFYKELSLNNNQRIILRSPSKDDAIDIIEYYKKSHDETDFLSSDSSEFNPSIQQEESWIKDIVESEKKIAIFAIIDNKIIGGVGVEPISKLSRFNHRCNIGIAILKDYWGMGIGRILMDEAINKAKEIGYKQIELDVLESNTRAYALYIKLGFNIIGKNPSGLIINGIKEVELRMMKEI